MEAGGSRERTTESSHPETLGRRCRGRISGHEAKAREGSSVARRSAAKAGNLGRQNPKEAIDAGNPIKPRACGRAVCGVKNPWRGSRNPQDPAKPHEGLGVREGVRHRGRSKTSKGEPQERDRDGISPGGAAGSKASRGSETLRTQRNRTGREPAGGMWLRDAPKTLKGRKTSEGARRSRLRDGASR